MQQLVEANAPFNQIVHETGLSPRTIRNWIVKHGWEYHPTGEKKNTATARHADTVVTVFDRQYAAGTVSAVKIAQETGISDGSVAKILRLHRGEQWQQILDGKREVRTCTGCHETLPISSFPERTDRIGLTHAQCFTCRRDWSRVYRHNNPVPIREASRRRRSWINQARTDGHSEVEVSLDAGCFFCHEPIDLGLSHPDPMALSIHHIHPISKYGPDVLKNVAAAHARCNRIAKDNYVPLFADWAVAPMPVVAARALVIEKHYLHRPPNASFAYGCYDDRDQVVAVITFGSPSSRRISLSASSDPDRVLELNRLWVDDAAPFGLGSWFVSRAMKQLTGAIVVAYADLAERDPRYGSAHEGGIYRACSFHYAGTSRPNTEWIIPGKSRNVGKHADGAVKVSVSPKARYWRLTGSRSDRRALAPLVKWPSLSGRPAAFLRDNPRMV